MDVVLYHHGVKGMKWGVRRYQRKDGSLTAAGKKRRRENENEQAKKKQEQETVEQRRARLLKSSNAQELYENRHLLSTSEINERLTRIDTERRLGNEAAKSKQTFAKKVDKVLEVGKKINEVYEFTQTPIMKALKAKLAGEEVKVEPEAFDINKVWKNKDKLSTKELENAANRLKQEAVIQGYMNKSKKSTTSESDGASTAKSKKSDDDSSKSDTTKKTSKADDAASGNKKTSSDNTKKAANKSDEPKAEFLGKSKDKSDSTDGGSEPKTKNTYESKDYVDYDAPGTTATGRNYITRLFNSNSNTSSANVTSSSNNDVIELGQTYIAGLLEAPKE